MTAGKKAQIWSMDLLIGITLFFVGITLFFVYSLNQTSEAENNFEFLSYDARIITDNLMSSGYPTDWNSTNIITPGITDDGKINQTKLERLYNMTLTQNDYITTKNFFNTGYEYFFFLDQNMTIGAITIEGIGKPGATQNNIAAKNLVKITRFTIYENKTTPLYLYLWEE